MSLRSLAPWPLVLLAATVCAAPACNKTQAPETETPSGDSSAPAYDPCAGKACGEQCKLCAPDDTDCMETMEVKACDAEGACVSQTEGMCPSE